MSSRETIIPFWFIPTHGDGRYLGSPDGARPTDFSYLAQVGQAADRLGFHGALLPTGRTCEDSWVVASALATLTQRLKLLVAEDAAGKVTVTWNSPEWLRARHGFPEALLANIAVLETLARKAAEAD